MIGERLESHRSLPWGALLLLAAGLGLAAAGLISGIDEMVIAAVLPLALGGSLWLLGRESPFTATCREEGLEIERAGEPILVPYASIQNIKVGGRLADPAGFRKASCPIDVLHEGGRAPYPLALEFPLPRSLPVSCRASSRQRRARREPGPGRVPRTSRTVLRPRQRRDLSRGRAAA